VPVELANRIIESAVKDAYGGNGTVAVTDELRAAWQHCTVPGHMIDLLDIMRHPSLRDAYAHMLMATDESATARFMPDQDEYPEAANAIRAVIPML
jgi:hypothetical protein